MLKSLKNDKTVIGTMLSELYSPNITRLFKTCGFDFCIIDCEHGYFDYAMVANIIAVASGYEYPVLVRIPAINRECILKYMDMGASGLVVPMVSRAEDAEKVVEYSKYAPLGNRGVSTTRAHNNYHSADFNQYMVDANTRTLVLVQIESAEGVANAGQIAKIKGLSGLLIGPNDLSLDMGVLGNYEDKRFEAAVERVIEAAQDHDLYSGIISSNIKLLNRCVEKGMRILSCNSELGMISGSAKQALNSLRHRS
jgi:2-keto-3-deoxy-L-rhamnonate aldolase RhmA